MDPTPDTPAPAPSVAGADPDLTGRTLGDFYILRRLGQGGMGQVYLAEQLSLKRKVALKLLRADLAADATALKRFQVEAEAAARIAHANIVQVHAIGESAGLHYMALEFVDGRNLRDFLAKKGPPELPLALSIMRQVAAALQRAGEQGIVHRDIKPENILLTRKGEVKVADFGLSRCFAGDQKPLNLTQSGVTMGTPLYMSPEQVQGQPVDPRSDIYSFGVTCYHMLSGQPPFKGQTAFEVAIQHVQKEPAALTELRPDLPPGLCAIVHKMMAKEPEKRYQSARELLLDLARLRETLPPELAGPAGTSSTLTPLSSSMFPAISSGTLAPASGTVLPPTVKLTRFVRRRWRQGLLLAAFLVGLLGGLALGLHRRFGRVFPPDPPSAAREPVLLTNPEEIQEQQLRARVAQDFDPSDPEQVKKALRHHIDLGLFYLSQDPRRLAEADAFFLQLVQAPPKDKEAFRTLGHLGHAMVLAFQDQAKESNEEMVKVLKDRLAKARQPGDEGYLLFEHPQLRAMLAVALDYNLRNSPGKRLPGALEVLREIPNKPRTVLKPPLLKPDKPPDKDKSS